MRKIYFSLLFLVALPVLVFAQPGGYTPGGRTPESNVLSIYSEAGDFFFVVINGVTQNLAPQSSIRIEGVMQPLNDIQIMFADNRTREVRKSVNVANPIDHRAVDLIIKLERERDGDVKMRLDRCVPRENNYQPLQGEYVMFFGQDVARQVIVEDRDRHHGHGDNHYGDHGGRGEVIVKETIVQQPAPIPVPAPPPVPVGPQPMNEMDFQSAKQSIANNSFDDTKLSTAKMVANGNYFTCDQVIQICQLFSFEDTKLNFAKHAYKKTVDNNSYYRVNDVFTFESSKESMNNFVTRGGH